VEEVALLGRAPHLRGSESARDRDIVAQALAATGTLALRHRLYPTLSGGERQRVQAARVLAQVWEGPAPRALLLDEPTSSLDLAHQHLLLRLARRMAAEGCAVLCVLHDLNLAAQYADRVAVLVRGALRTVAPPAQALTPALLAEAFGVHALVMPHPQLACPLVAPLGPLERPAPSPSTPENVDAP
jgi:iron complex transport system ATP-binding protein